MSAGTLTLANNSDVVAGIDTSFTNDLSAGDFIVVTTGGVTYTLPVKTIESDIALTLARNYNGPAVTAGAWTAMPRDTLNRISAQIAADTAYIIRQRVLEVDNWYQLLEVNGDVVIKMADGSSYTGPSWLKLIDIMKTLKIDELIPIAEQIRADAQQVADDKPVIIQAKDDAQAAAAAAAESENNSATSEKNAAASKDTATQKAEEAAESARQAAESNPLLALQKSLNLSDLADRAAAWLNLRPIGATPLAADAVNDYDAPTWRQVRNLIESGTTGPTMNGVMNYHIGEAVPWETRAYYPPNCLPRDGQLVNRADWPELWAWAQKTTPITDAAWLADVTKRGAYSTGNGTTTFRLPDWNGVQSGSIPGVFFRGGVGAADMIMSLSAAPNITGSFTPMFPNVSHIPGRDYVGAITPTGDTNGYTLPGGGIVSGTENRGMLLNASLSSAVYGRNNTSEVVPNKVSGVWLVRASGGFVAANTSWSVINGDASAPATNTVVQGGKIVSDYLIAKAMHLRSSMYADGLYGVRGGGVWHIEDSLGNKRDIIFDLSGKVTVPVTLSVEPPNDVNEVGIAVRRDAIGGSTRFGGAMYMGFNRVIAGYDFYPQVDSDNSVHVFERIFNTAGAVVSTYAKHSNGSYTAYNGSFVNGSDLRIKKEVEIIPDALTKMRQIKGCTWRLKVNDNFGIGFIAQDVESVFPEAVSTGNYTQELPDGSKVENVKALNAGDVAAALHHESILQLMDIVKEAITTIAGVTTDDSAKAALAALAERIPARDLS